MEHFIARDLGRAALHLSLFPGPRSVGSLGFHLWFGFGLITRTALNCTQAALPIAEASYFQYWNWIFGQKFIKDHQFGLSALVSGLHSQQSYLFPLRFYCLQTEDRFGLRG